MARLLYSTSHLKNSSWGRPCPIQEISSVRGRQFEEKQVTNSPKSFIVQGTLTQEISSVRGCQFEEKVGTSPKSFIVQGTHFVIWFRCFRNLLPDSYYDLIRPTVDSILNATLKTIQYLFLDCNKKHKYSL